MRSVQIQHGKVDVYMVSLLFPLFSNDFKVVQTKKCAHTLYVLCVMDTSRQTSQRPFPTNEPTSQSTETTTQFGIINYSHIERFKEFRKCTYDIIAHCHTRINLIGAR